MNVIDLVQAGRIFSSPARVKIVEELQKGPHTVEELGRKLGLKPITVHHHVRLLARLGVIVETTPQRSGKSGRPWSMFRLADEPVAVQFPQRAYRQVAEMLLSLLKAKLSPRSLHAAARSLGENAGNDLANALLARSGLGRWTIEDLRRWFIEEHLSRSGFTPEVVEESPDHLRYRLHNCLALELAKQHPDFICAMDLPMMEAFLRRCSKGGKVERTCCMATGAAHCEYLVQIRPPKRTGSRKAVRAR